MPRPICSGSRSTSTPCSASTSSTSTCAPLRRRLPADGAARAAREVCADAARARADPAAGLTTNYDDALERAFDEARRALSTLWYEAKQGRRCGYFMHRRDDEVVAIRKPNETLLGRPRGDPQAARGDRPRRPQGDSYVITEDNYIDYLARATSRARSRSRCASGSRTAICFSWATRCATGTCG